MATFRTFFLGRMSGLEITCLKSFLDHGHRVIVFAYDGTEVPKLFERQDAASILPQERIFYYRHGRGQGSVAGFTNLFRYALLERYGDWWIDTDVLCRCSQWPLSECVTGWESASQIGSAVLKLPAHIARICRSRCEALGEGVRWGEAGPRLVTSVLREQEMLDHVLPPEAFYPISYRCWADLLNPTKFAASQEQCANSFGVHIWHEMMRRDGIDKRRLPPAGSFFSRAITVHMTERYFESSLVVTA